MAEEIRLQADDLRLLLRLRHHLGVSDREIVRRGLEALAATVLPAERIVGQGAFASECDDLGSNDEHMSDFARKP